MLYILDAFYDKNIMAIDLMYITVITEYINSEKCLYLLLGKSAAILIDFFWLVHLVSVAPPRL